MEKAGKIPTYHCAGEKYGIPTPPRAFEPVIVYQLYLMKRMWNAWFSLSYPCIHPQPRYMLGDLKLQSCNTCCGCEFLIRLDLTDVIILRCPGNLSLAWSVPNHVVRLNLAPKLPSQLKTDNAYFGTCPKELGFGKEGARDALSLTHGCSSCIWYHLSSHSSSTQQCPSFSLYFFCTCPSCQP